MATPREVIATLCKQGKDGVNLPLFRGTTRWVQYKMRSQIGGGLDDVYYEVNTVDECVVAQLHARMLISRTTSELREKLCKEAERRRFKHTRTTSQQFEIFAPRGKIVCADYNSEEIVKMLVDDIKILYDAFEGIIAKYDSQCPATTNKVECVKKRSNNKKPSDKKWFVNYKYDTSACDDRYDGKLKDIPGLTWLPWVGKGYCDTRILVVGESNYTDEGMAAIVDGDKWFTRKVSNYFCISEQERRAGQAMRYIARRLMTSVHDTVPKVWSQIAYMDVCQKCLVKVEGERPRPTPDNYESGVLPVCSVVDVLRPKLVIFVSKGAFDYFKNRQCLRKLKDYSILTYLNAPTETIGKLHTKNCDVPVAFTTHPGGFGATASIKWRIFFKEHFQDVVPYCKDIVVD